MKREENSFNLEVYVLWTYPSEMKTKLRHSQLKEKEENFQEIFENAKEVLQAETR